MPQFDDIPLVDGHMHPPLLEPEARPFVSFFTEAGADEATSRHVRASLFFQRALRGLAELLDCEPTEESVRAARSQYTLRSYMRLIVQTWFKTQPRSLTVAAEREAQNNPGRYGRGVNQQPANQGGTNGPGTA